MKKLIFLFLLIPILCYGAAGDVASIGGKAVTAVASIDGKAGTAILTYMGKPYSDGDSVACTTSTDEELDASHYGAADDGYGNASNTQYLANKVEFTGTLTAYIIRGYEDLASGTTTCELWTNSTDRPGTLVADTSVTVDQASLPATVGDYEFALAAPKAGLSGVYWIVCRASAAQYRFSRDTINDVGAVSSSADSGSTWAAPNTAYVYRSKIMGCP